MAKRLIKRERLDDRTTATPRKSRHVTIDAALLDPHLLGAALDDDKSSWGIWFAVLRAAFGLPLTDDDLEHFKSVAGDRQAPTQRVDELWAVVGRRSGKTRTAAAICVFVAVLERHRLAPGEIGYVLLLAASRDQAGNAFDYVLGFLQSSPVLRQQIVSVTANEVRLRGNIIIGVHSNNFRTIRGKSLLCVVGDETSFWRDDSSGSATPDIETYRACIPALAATGGMWIGISTGYRKIGLLYQKWRDHFGQNSNDVLVVQGSTELFNPTFSKRRIEKAKSDDPEAAESEWMGGFRNDLAAFLDDATIDAAIDASRPLELPPRDEHTYFAFCDASGGRHDAYTICVGHKEGERIIADVIRGTKAPFDPHTVTKEYADLLKQYSVRKVVGDNYSAAWVESAWRAENISYERSEINRSQIYIETLPVFARGLVSMPNQPILIRELRLLERRTSVGGRDQVNHPIRNGSDDWANSFCGMLHLLSRSRKGTYDATLNWVISDEEIEQRSGSAQRLSSLLSTRIRGF